MRTVSDLLLSTIIEKRPLVLLLGQNAWSESRDTEPLLSRALDKLGRIDRTQSSWKEIISDQAPPPDYMDWLAERFDRRVHPEFVETLGALPWSAIFTSALDPTLPKFLSVGGREAEPILTASEIPRAARSTARPPLYYLFSRAGERDPRALPPTDQIELSIRRTQHAIPLLNRMLETATSLGTIVVDGFHLSGDWLRFEEMLGTLASASVNQVLWFGGYPDLQNDDKSTFETLERTGRILVEPLRLGSVIAELKATGRLDDVIQAETEDVGTISFGDNSYLGITPENRLRVEAAASVVDDSWTSFLAPMGPDASYDAFRRFHGVLGGPRLLVEGVRRGFAITRDFERELLSHIYDALADHSKLQAPIIVEGQSGTGKSVALARIVARIRESKASPVLYALGRIPQPQDVASFCQSAERAGAQATLIVCDANRDVDSYDELLSGLRSRGRRVVVIGSQYREATQEEANTYLQLEAPVLISENERAKFSSLLGAYFENADYRQLEDNHFLAALYRCLPASRPRIGSGLSAEARSSERRLYRRGNQPRAVLPITRLHQQLIEKGFIKDHQPILGKHETKSPAELEGAAGRIIDFVMVAGSLNCPVPVNLLLRAATEQYGSIDSTLVSDLFRNLDLFRWESSDSEGNEWLIMPRLTLEAQLICQRRLGSAQAEADCLLALIGSVRQGIDNSQEREFLSTLLQQIRRHGPSGNRYIHSYMAFARKLTELREHFNVVDANLMLQESAFRRSAVQGEQIEDATDLELLEESLDAVQTAIDEINNGRLRAGRRTRQSLLVERAAIFGYLANYRVQQEGKADEVWSAYRATRVAIRQAMSAADDYYPLDVGLWAPADLFKTDILTESQKAELAADIYSTMDLVEEEALPPSQRNRFQQRRMSVGITLADQGLTEDAYAQLEASGSTAGYFLRAREYAPDLSKDEVEVNSDSALQEAKTASDFLEERFDRILHDERCLSLLLECRWICEMHRRPLRGEGQPLPVGISRRHILEIVRALNLAAGESSRYGTRYLEAVLTWLTEDYFEAREIFRQLDHDTDNVYRRRIFKRHLISSPTGVPESFSGRVVSQVGEGRWRISVNELNQTIALLEAIFLEKRSYTVERFPISQSPLTSSAQSLIQSGGEMTFSQVNAEYVQLRNSLSTFVGEGALDEVSVQPPASEDEASFLRLIAWSYALTFEVGRVSIPYLLKQPAENDIRQREARSARDLVNNLRTWSFHNLGLHSDRSIRISSDVSLWFIQICGSNPPQNNEDWQSCFESLCSEVSSILTHCRDALNSVLADPDNKSDVITVLNQRIDRSWPAHKFDAIVGDAAMRMGLTIDVVEFRSRRLNKWRQYLETIPVDDAPEMLVVRLIERDLLEHYRAVLPIDSNDVMAALELQPGQDVALAMSIAYRMFDSGLSDPVRLLAELEQWHASRK